MTEDIVIHDRLRVQVLSTSLVRIEEYGPKGFEDRPSFNVLKRDWPRLPVSRSDATGRVELTTDSFRIAITGPRPTIESVRIHAADGSLLFDGARSLPPKVFLPDPADAMASWAFSDQPRVIPPAWGALPPPPEGLNATSGWDLENQARDVFVFLPGRGGYRRLVADFLSLTGRVPLPPLCALGLIDSRYYPYKQDEALDVIDTFRKRDIPLDIFVLDTDWRVGASHGYGVNTELIPDMARFVRDAHARGVRVMLNDHPEPSKPVALSPDELNFRFEGLTSLLKLGVDYWWFDRNWHVTISEPAPGLSKEVWGMCLYRDIAQAHRPEERALVMSNVEGIDNGHLNGPSSPAAHRYPIWWTGDTRATWHDLRRGVQNAVNGGVRSLLPYISEDLGGHHDTPDEELYTRFVQYGALSPICRLHCSANLYRHPWRFGVAGEIVADYIRLRYRLLPTLYAAAREAFDAGTPLVRRCDLEWPEYPEARIDTQYLLGADLLVAPILESVVPLRPVPSECLWTHDKKTGLDAEYFSNMQLEGDPAIRRVETDITHGWFDKPPAPLVPARNFSVRWTGEFGPVPENGLYRLAIRTDDRAQVWLDGKLIIDYGDRPGPVYKSADVLLQSGRRYALRIEYRATGTWHAMCEFLWGRHKRTAAERSVWLPPGDWYNLWTGQLLEGPASTGVSASLAQVPLFARAGGLVFSIPPRAFSGEAVWPELALDWFAPVRSGVSSRELYEDDGHSRAYLDGECRKTRFTAESRDGEHRLTIEPARGALSSAMRAVTVRVHGLGRAPVQVLVDEKPFEAARWVQTTQRIPLGDLAVRGAATPGPVLELNLDPCSVSEPRLITVRV